MLQSTKGGLSTGGNAADAQTAGEPEHSSSTAVADEIVKIESLTAEQEAQFSPWVDKWTAIGLSTEPADRPKAMRAVRGLYAQSDLAQVPLAWVSSPIVGALAASLLSVIVPEIRRLIAELCTRHQISAPKKVDYSQFPETDVFASDQFQARMKRTLEDVSEDWVCSDDPNVLSAIDIVCEQVLNMELAPVLDILAEQRTYQVANRESCRIGMQVAGIITHTMMKEQLEWHAWYGGQFWCAFAAWATFFRDVLKVSVPQIEHEAHLCESAGYIWPNEVFCLICERPNRLTVVADRLDDGEGPAMEYPDGWQLWFIGGHRVNKQIVMEPEKQTLKEIQEATNEEEKRIRINRWGGRGTSNVVGWTKFINESGAEPLDQRRNDMENTEELLVKSATFVLFAAGFRRVM